MLVKYRHEKLEDAFPKDSLWNFTWCATVKPIAWLNSTKVFCGIEELLSVENRCMPPNHELPGDVYCVKCYNFFDISDVSFNPLCIVDIKTENKDIKFGTEDSTIETILTFACDYVELFKEKAPVYQSMDTFTVAVLDPHC